MPRLIADTIFTGKELVQVLKELEWESVRNSSGFTEFKICAYLDDEKLWEYHDVTSELFFDEKSNNASKIIEAIEICGAGTININFCDENMNTDVANWTDWFLKKIGNKYLIPDTNFIYRHYGSAKLSNISSDNMRKLQFFCPRLVILEIERRGNNNKQTEVARMEKRMAFFAVKEIHDLRQTTNFDMIPQSDTELVTGFTTRAGKGFADMWIRQEVHAAIDEGFFDKDLVLFLTCDLMNAMSAEAEGIETCYFSRIPQKSYHVRNNVKSVLPKFLLANAIIFGELKLKIILNESNLSDTILLQGIWPGKTTAEWYQDCVKISHNIK